MLHDLIKFWNLFCGVTVLSMGITLGMYVVCRLAKWAPINIHIHLTRSDVE